MDKLIIFGRVDSFYSERKQKYFYFIDYLDADTGTSNHDFIDEKSYMNISSKNIKVGELVKAVFQLNQWNRGIISDCIFE